MRGQRKKTGTEAGRKTEERTGAEAGRKTEEKTGIETKGKPGKKAGTETGVKEESRKKKFSGRNGAEACFGESLRAFSETAADYCFCAYLFLMLAVFPLYCQDGYSHIGTDKAYFFCRVSVYAGGVLACVLALRLAAEGTVFWNERKKGRSFCSGDSKAKAFGRERSKSRAAKTPVPSRSFFSRSREAACRFWGKIRQNDFLRTDFFALFYAGAALISYVCTEYKEEALWGATGWYMGLIPQLILVLICLLTPRLWKPGERMAIPLLTVSAAVFLLGCVNRFGIYPVKMRYASPSFISTVGNINWFCGYAVATVFFGAALLWVKRDWKPVRKVLLMLYVGVGFAALVLQGSESGLVALGAVLLVMFCMSVKDGGRMVAFWQEMTLLWGGCLLIFAVRLLFPDSMNYREGLVDRLTWGTVPVIMTAVSAAALTLLLLERKRGRYPKRIFLWTAYIAVCGITVTAVSVLGLAAVNTVHPGSIGTLSEYSLFTLDENWGSFRGATWSVGWRCFAGQNVLHKLVGVGPDCMPEYLYGGASEELLAAVRERFGEARLTNAHNEWLTVLVNTGILGLIGYVGMMLGGIRQLLQRGSENPFACACGFCLLGYTVNNIFSFQQAMSVGTVFVIFGMGRAFLQRERRKRPVNPA
ncbi:MAG: O-antigen ligase family protein [bacterium]|nr:O-antigen ligase family protein [bacterium]